MAVAHLGFFGLEVEQICMEIRSPNACSQSNLLLCFFPVTGEIV